MTRLWAVQAATCRVGERQRIAIARAMLKDAPIIIFDEATAYLDPENESLIQEAISKLVQGKTLIYGRSSTLYGDRGGSACGGESGANRGNRHA